MLKVYQQVSVLGPDKKYVHKGRKTTSRSFVKAFVGILARQFAYNVSYTFADVYGTSRAGTSLYNMLFCNAGGGLGNAVGGASNAVPDISVTCPSNDIYGIVVGSSNTAVSITDVALTTRISHGTSAGKLEYFGMLISPVVVSAPNATFTLERIFRNSTGNSVDVKEIGLYGMHNVDWGTLISYCLIRDVLGATVTVGNGQYLKVTYTISITA